MNRNYFLRSMLFVPGDKEKMLLKASKTEADALIIDMEDSVITAENKIKARKLCCKMLSNGIFSNFQIFVRTNDRNSEHIKEEVKQFAKLDIDGFVFPKAYSNEDIEWFDQLITDFDPGKKFKIIPLIETCSSLINLDCICKASDRIIAIAFGSEDFITDLNGAYQDNSISFQYPRVKIAIAAHANKIIPIDTVHIQIHDLSHLKLQLNTAVDLGFEGMLCLHPKEIEYANRCFSPTKREFQKAENILNIAGEMEKQQKGVFLIKQKFIAPPVVKKAKKLIDRYQSFKKFEQQKSHS